MLSQLSQPLWSIVLLAPWALYLPSLSGHGRSMQPRFILRWSGHWPNWRNRWWQSMKSLWQTKTEFGSLFFLRQMERFDTHMLHMNHMNIKSWEHLHLSHFIILLHKMTAFSLTNRTHLDSAPQKAPRTCRIKRLPPAGKDSPRLPVVCRILRPIRFWNLPLGNLGFQAHEAQL